MKQNIFRILVLLLFTAAYSSCEPDDYPVPDIALTPVYAISQTGNNTLFSINVYQNVSRVTVWNKDGLGKSYPTKNYVDSSGESDYNIMFTAEETVTVTDSEGVKSTAVVTYDYVITGSKSTSVVSVVITKTGTDGVITTTTLPMAKIKLENIYD